MNVIEQSMLFRGIESYSYQIASPFPCYMSGEFIVEVTEQFAGYKYPAGALVLVEKLGVFSESRKFEGFLLLKNSLAPLKEICPLSDNRVVVKSVVDGAEIVIAKDDIEDIFEVKSICYRSDM